MSTTNSLFPTSRYPLSNLTLQGTPAISEEERWRYYINNPNASAMQMNSALAGTTGYSELDKIQGNTDAFVRANEAYSRALHDTHTQAGIFFQNDPAINSLTQVAPEVATGGGDMSSMLSGLSNASPLSDSFEQMFEIVRGLGTGISQKKREEQELAAYREKMRNSLVNNYAYAAKGGEVKSDNNSRVPMYNDVVEDIPTFISKLAEAYPVGKSKYKDLLSPKDKNTLFNFISSMEGHAPGSAPVKVANEKDLTTTYGMKQIKDEYSGEWRPVNKNDKLDKATADMMREAFFQEKVLTPFKDKYGEAAGLIPPKVLAAGFDGIWNAGAGSVLEGSPKFNRAIQAIIESKGKNEYAIQEALKEANWGGINKDGTKMEGSKKRIKFRQDILNFNPNVDKLAEGGVATILTEAELGEYTLDTEGNVVKVEGNKHEDGGTLLNLEEGTRVVSDQGTLGGEFAKYVRNIYGINVKFNDTYADSIDKYVRKLKISDLEDEVTKIEKQVKEQDRVKDDATKSLNLQFLQKKYEEKATELQKAQVLLADFTKVMFDKQEKAKGKSENKSNPTTLAKGGTIDGNKIAALALEYDIPLERAYEMLNMPIQKADAGITVKSLYSTSTADNKSSDFFSDPLLTMEEKLTKYRAQLDTIPGYSKADKDNLVGLKAKTLQLAPTSLSINSDPSLLSYDLSSGVYPEFASTGAPASSKSMNVNTAKGKEDAGVSQEGKDAGLSATDAKIQEAFDRAKRLQSAKNYKANSYKFPFPVLMPPEPLQLTSLQNPQLEQTYPKYQTNEEALKNIYLAEGMGLEQMKDYTDPLKLATLASVIGGTQEQVNKSYADLFKVNAGIDSAADTLNLNLRNQNMLMRMQGRADYEQKTLSAIDKTKQEQKNYFESYIKQLQQRAKAKNDLAMIQTLSPQFYVDEKGEIKFNNEDAMKLFAAAGIIPPEITEEAKKKKVSTNKKEG